MPCRTRFSNAIARRSIAHCRPSPSAATGVPYPESASPKVYGEGAAEAGKAAFDALKDKPFPLDQPGTVGTVGGEKSPYGFALGITYPKADVDALFAAVAKAQVAWRAAGPEAWAGVCLEILHRINQQSFLIANAVMHTTGQAFMMAFQAGGPHAQDRGLEAVAYAWDELRRIPAKAHWEKPQGKNEPIRMEKHFRVVPRGIGLVIGCCTFPTWNGYPGLFADLATGNAVVVKPHPAAILPLALSVKIAREVLAEAGFDPNVVTMVAHAAGDDVAQKLALRADVKLIDFTGSAANGNWLEANARQAQVFTEKSGVNQIVVDSASDFKGVVRNVAFSLSLYTGQMCTAPQNIYIPQGGIDTAEGHLSFDQVAGALAEGVQKLLADPARAVEFLGAVVNDGVMKRLESARTLGTGGARYAGDRASGIPRCDDPHAADREARGGGHREVPRRMVRADRIRHRHQGHGGEPGAGEADGAGEGRAHVFGLFDAPGGDRAGDRGGRGRRRRAVDQPHRRGVRQPVGGVLGLPRHRCQCGGERRADRRRVRRRPVPCGAAPDARLRSAARYGCDPVDPNLR